MGSNRVFSEQLHQLQGKDTHNCIHVVQSLGICINAGMKDQMIGINYLNVSQHLNVYVITFIICIVYTSSFSAET